MLLTVFCRNLLVALSINDTEWISFAVQLKKARLHRYTSPISSSAVLFIKCPSYSVLRSLMEGIIYWGGSTVAAIIFCVQYICNSFSYI